jgi:hypothetical protein
MYTDDDIINRDKRIDVRVTDYEKKEIAERAARAGLGVSEYVRRAALDHVIVELLTQSQRANLVGIGRNLNQALAISHAQQEVLPGVKELITKLKEILQA